MVLTGQSSIVILKKREIKGQVLPYKVKKKSGTFEYDYKILVWLSRRENYKDGMREREEEEKHIVKGNALSFNSFRWREEMYTTTTKKEERGEEWRQPTTTPQKITKRNNHMPSWNYWQPDTHFFPPPILFRSCFFLLLLLFKKEEEERLWHTKAVEEKRLLSIEKERKVWRKNIFVWLCTMSMHLGYTLRTYAPTSN